MKNNAQTEALLHHVDICVMKEERLKAGQCPMCGQQLYKWTKTSFPLWLVPSRHKVRKIPLSVPGLVERGQCLQCDLRLKDSSNATECTDPNTCSDMKEDLHFFDSNSQRRIHHQQQMANVNSTCNATSISSSATTCAVFPMEHTAVYAGDYNEKGEKHGKGIMTWSNGDRYEGNFVQDRRCGHGILNFYGKNQDGGEYVGDWFNDKMHGTGSRRYPNGDMYVGNFVEGKRDGDGRFYFANGDLYCGKWKNNLMHGLGNYYFSSGVRFEGMFLFNKRNGKGKTQGSTGSIDIFQYINDERVGQGVRFNSKRTHAWRLIQRADGTIRQNGSAPVDRHRIPVPEAMGLVHEIENASKSHIEELLTTRGDPSFIST